MTDELEARVALAKQLLAAQDHAAATDVIVELWGAMQAVGSERFGWLGELVRLVPKLIRAYPEARARFEPFLAELDPKDDPDPHYWNLAQWFRLHKLCGDSAARLAWFDRMHDRLVQTERMQHFLDGRVVPLLLDAGRTADAGRLYVDPIGLLDHAIHILALGRESGDNLRAVIEHDYRPRTARMVRALRAAGRTAEADAIEARALAAFAQ